jgi:carbamoyltransferase
MKLLSLRLCGHDSNISYFDGNTVRYYRSERDYQIKHHAFNNLWEWRDVIKRVWNLDYKDVDEIAIIFEPVLYNFPNAGEDIFPYTEYDLFPAHCKVYRLDHHYAHSLSSWMLNDQEADIHIVIDGCGDAETATSWSVIKDDSLIARGKLDDSDSIGRLIITLGDFLGIPRSNPSSSCKLTGLDTAGKVMSLQSYGKIDNEFLNKLQQYDFFKADEIYDFLHWIDHKNDELLARHSGLNWANTVHHHTGNILLEFFKKFVKQNDVVTYTGGVAQNIVWNSILKKHFKNLIIPPHCADDGLSLGGIEFLRRKNNLPKLKIDNFPYVQSDEVPEMVSDETIRTVVDLLANGKIVAWYQGNGEIGPRALGNRSILMDPRISNGKDRINQIKKRENFRPFGASMLAAHSTNLFEIDFDDPFMLYTYKVKDKNLRSITHIDETCRVQCVTDANPSFKKLLEKFYELTGCPVLLNTSLNVNGRPIAGRLSDATELFDSSEIDYLIFGNKIFKK